MKDKIHALARMRMNKNSDYKSAVKDNEDRKKKVKKKILADDYLDDVTDSKEKALDIAQGSITQEELEKEAARRLRKRQILSGRRLK